VRLREKGPYEIYENYGNCEEKIFPHETKQKMMQSE
jgi:hypothetical protein